MTVQVSELKTVDFLSGKTTVADVIDTPKGYVEMEIRVDRQTALNSDAFTDTRLSTVHLLRSKDGLKWEEAVSFSAHGGFKIDTNGMEAEYSSLAFRIRDDGWKYRVEVDSPSAQKIPIQIYFNSEYEKVSAPVDRSRNSVGYVDNELYTGTNIASFTTAADLTITGSDVAVYTGITGRDGSSWSVSSCKWNGSGGSDMTAVSGTDTGAYDLSYAYIRSQFYRALASIVSGSAKVYVAFSLTVDYVVVESTSWNTVDQSTPELDTWNETADSGTPGYGQDVQLTIDDTMTTASGNKVMGISLSVHTSYTAPISQTGSAATSISNGSNVNRSYRTGYWSPTGSTHTIGFNAARGLSYAYQHTYIVGSAVSIKEATGAGSIDEPVTPGALHLTGFAPQTLTFGGKTSEPVALGALHLTGYAPSTLIFGGKVSEPIPAGAFILTGYAPAFNRPFIREPIGTGYLTLTGFAPATFIPFVREPIGAGNIRLTASAPEFSVSGGATREPIPGGQLTLTGYAPEMFRPFIREPIDAGTLTLTGYAPAYSIPADISEAIPPNVLSLTGYAPRFSIPSTAVEGPLPAGSSKRPARRTVIIGNRKYVIENNAQLAALLQAYLDNRNEELAQIKALPEKTPKQKKRYQVLATQVAVTEKRISALNDQEEEELILMMIA